MSEKMQDIIREGIDSNALALSFLRLGKFEDAVSFFTEALNENKESPVTLLGLLSVHLRAKKFADYVLGMEKEPDIDEIQGEALSTYASIVLLTIKVLEGDVGERFIHALDLYLCRLLSVGDFVLFAKICPVMPKEAPVGQPYQFVKEYTKQFDNVAKTLSSQPFDILSGLVYDRMLTNGQRRELTERAIAHFTKKSVRGGIASWYGKLMLLEDVTVDELQKGVDDMLALSMANEANILLRQILLRDPENANAKQNALLITLQSHINSSSFSALCGEKEAVVSYLDSLGKSNSSAISAFVELLKPVVTKVYSSLGHFDLLDAILDRLYASKKSAYAKACIEIANDCLQNGLFDVAKAYYSNALPHAGKNAHKAHFALLMIALKCKNEEELKSSLEFKKNMEEYRTLLFAVRDDEKLLKYYSDLADEIEKNQIVRRDAETLLTLMVEQDKLLTKERKKDRSVAKIALIIQWAILVFGVVFYFTRPFVFNKSLLIVLIPFAAGIGFYYLYSALRHRRREKCVKAFSYKEADLVADEHYHVGRLGKPFGATVLCAVAALFVAFIFFPGGDIDGFGRGYLYSYSSYDDGIEIVSKGIIDPRLSIIPDKIKGYEVVEVSIDFYKKDEVVFESYNTYRRLNDCVRECETVCIIASTLEDIKSAISSSSIDYIYFDGTQEELDEVMGEDNFTNEKVYTRRTSANDNLWVYNLRGIPKRK